MRVMLFFLLAGLTPSGLLSALAQERSPASVRAQIEHILDEQMAECAIGGAA